MGLPLSAGVGELSVGNPEGYPTERATRLGRARGVADRAAATLRGLFDGPPSDERR